MAHKEIAAFEDLATQIFDFAESFPRLADLGVEPLRGAPGERGALLLQGPLKMLQTSSSRAFECGAGGSGASSSSADPDHLDAQASVGAPPY